MPINRYDKPLLSEYINTYVPLPYEELAKNVAQKQQVADNAIAKTQKLDEVLGSLSSQTFDEDLNFRNQYIQNFTDKKNKLIEESLKTGNFSALEQGTRELGQKLASVLDGSAINSENLNEEAIMAAVHRAGEREKTTQKEYTEVAKKEGYDPAHPEKFFNYVRGDVSGAVLNQLKSGKKLTETLGADWIAPEKRFNYDEISKQVKEMTIDKTKIPTIQTPQIVNIKGVDVMIDGTSTTSTETRGENRIFGFASDRLNKDEAAQAAFRNEGHLVLNDSGIYDNQSLSKNPEILKKAITQNLKLISTSLGGKPVQGKNESKEAYMKRLASYSEQMSALKSAYGVQTDANGNVIEMSIPENPKGLFLDVYQKNRTLEESFNLVDQYRIHNKEQEAKLNTKFVPKPSDGGGSGAGNKTESLSSLKAIPNVYKEKDGVTKFSEQMEMGNNKYENEHFENYKKQFKAYNDWKKLSDKQSYKAIKAEDVIKQDSYLGGIIQHGSFNQYLNTNGENILTLAGIDLSNKKLTFQEMTNKLTEYLIKNKNTTWREAQDFDNVKENSSLREGVKPPNKGIINNAGPEVMQRYANVGALLGLQKPVSEWSPEEIDIVENAMYQYDHNDNKASGEVFTNLNAARNPIKTDGSKFKLVAGELGVAPINEKDLENYKDGKYNVFNLDSRKDSNLIDDGIADSLEDGKYFGEGFTVQGIDFWNEVGIVAITTNENVEGSLGIVMHNKNANKGKSKISYKVVGDKGIEEHEVNANAYTTTHNIIQKGRNLSVGDSQMNKWINVGDGVEVKYTNDKEGNVYVETKDSPKKMLLTELQTKATESLYEGSFEGTLDLFNTKATSKNQASVYNEDEE